MEASRTKKSLKNVIFTLGSYFIILILQLINRTLFVHYLPVEYLGINGLFSNILSLLSLTELGIGTAMTYALYAPLRNNDKKEILSIMQLYKKMYSWIGIIVFCMGIILTPFLNIFISGRPDYITWPELRLYFIIYVINTSVSYFAAYKRSLLICDQKQYVTSVVGAISKICLTLGQIIIFITTRSYLIYIIAMIFATLGENIVLTVIANRDYPYLRDKKKYPISKKVADELKKNIYAMIFHRVGDVVINASDNIIITRFASLMYTGLYSNYLVIINAVRNVLNQIFSAVTASVGNLIAGNSKERDFAVFQKMLFINYAFYSFCALALTALSNDFVTIWLGKKYTLSMVTVVIVCLSFYFTGMEKTVRVFRDAAGVFYYDRYKPIVESLVNIAVSIPLTIRFQIAGAIGGTIISCLTVSFWVEGYVLFKHHFHRKVRGYFVVQLKYFLIYALMLGLVELTFSRISVAGIPGLLLKAVILAAEYILVMLVFFSRSEEFHYLIGLIQNIIKGRLH